MFVVQLKDFKDKSRQEYIIFGGPFLWLLLCITILRLFVCSSIRFYILRSFAFHLSLRVTLIARPIHFVIDNVTRFHSYTSDSKQLNCYYLLQSRILTPSNKYPQIFYLILVVLISIGLSFKFSSKNKKLKFVILAKYRSISISSVMTLIIFFSNC